MRLVGLDLGTKTLGVALSDKLGLIASKYGTITFESENYDEAIEKLKPILEEFNIDTIVLGLPKNMNGSLGFATERSLFFKEKLEKLNYKVILQDERLTSVEANNILINANVRREKRKEKVDTLSAVIILQSYLDRRK